MTAKSVPIVQYLIHFNDDAAEPLASKAAAMCCAQAGVTWKQNNKGTKMNGGNLSTNNKNKVDLSVEKVLCMCRGE